MARKPTTTTLDVELYQNIRMLALKLSINANDLMEEGMQYVLEKYEKENNDKK